MSKWDTVRLHWYRIGVCDKNEEAGEAIYECRNGMLIQNIVARVGQVGTEVKTS